MKAVRVFAALMLAPLAALAAEPADSLPPLFYVVAVSSQVTNIDSMGLTPGPAGNAERKSTLLHPIACMGGACRRIVDQPADYQRDWFAKLLAQEPKQAGRLAYIYVSFDGYYLHIIADLMDAKLDSAGHPVYGDKITVSYSGVCPRPQGAEEVAKLRSEPPTEGVLGSFGLQSQFLEWSGCTDERLLQVLRRSFDQFATFWQARLTPESAREIDAKLVNRPKLPFVRDVVAKDAAACPTQNGDFRVVRDLGDYFWLVYPDEHVKIANSIVITPRCGSVAE